MDRNTVLEQGRNALATLHKGQHWEQWLDVGRALVILRQEAMAEAETNEATGKTYSLKMKAKLDAEGLASIDKGDRSRLLSVMDNLPSIQAWRETLTDPERLKLNHPSTVFRKWQSATTPPKPREEKPPKPTHNEMEAMQAHIAELEAALDAEPQLTPQDAFSSLRDALRKADQREREKWAKRLQALLEELAKPQEPKPARKSKPKKAEQAQEAA